MNGSALAGSRASTHGSFGSGFGNSATSHTGLNNSAFRGAHFGNSFSHGSFDHVGFNHGFGFNHGGFGGFRHCFDCGFGFGHGWGWGGWGWGGWGWGWGWGLGWGWGWGGWGWNPWWWDPWLWGPPYAYYDPWWGWPAQQPDYAPGDFSDYYGNSPSSYNAPSSNPTLGYGSDLYGSLNNQPLGSPNLNPLTDNVANSTPTILLYLKDGTMLAAADYWIADGKLHYVVNYGGESVVDMDQVDLQRTVDENGKRGVKFWLKPNPNTTTGSPAASPAPGTPPSKEHPVESAQEVQPAD
jgi:hypothetical protein